MALVQFIFTGSTLTLLVAAFIFRKGNKGFMWIIGLLCLILLAQQSRVIGGIIYWALPETYGMKNSISSFVPFIVGGIQLLLALSSIFVGRGITLFPAKNPSANRWLFLLSGTFVFLCGYIFAVVSIYSPNLLGSLIPLPKFGLIIFIAASFVSALIINISSKMNSIERPNLLRWLSLFILLGCTSIISSFSLILIYAVPGGQNKSYPIYAGLAAIAYIPFSLLIFALVRDFVQVKKK